MKAGIIYQTFSYYMCDSACRWLIAKKARIFQSYAKQFGIFLGERILIGLCK